MKKIVIVGLLFGVLMLTVGCGNSSSTKAKKTSDTSISKKRDNTKETKGKEPVTTETQISNTTKETTTKTTTETTSQPKVEVEPSTLDEMAARDVYNQQNKTVSLYMKPYAGVDTSTYPYAVNMKDLISNVSENIQLGTGHAAQVPFFLEGMNIPNWITLDNTQTRRYDAGTIKFINRSFEETKFASQSFPYEIKQVPTTVIRVFDGSGKPNSTREIKVNSEVVLDLSNATNVEDVRYGQNKYYLFHNKNGGVSLATPNFAGNVATAEETKIMIEYTVTTWDNLEE